MYSTKVEFYCKTKSEIGMPVHCEMRLIVLTRAIPASFSILMYADLEMPIFFAISSCVIPAYFLACSMVNIRRSSTAIRLLSLRL
nr:MAG TPA: hypothetical protein [Caudoviricetes sp.]